MDFKLYLWICIHIIHCLVFRLSLCHWFHHLVVLFGDEVWQQSLVTIDGESRSQCVRTISTIWSGSPVQVTCAAALLLSSSSSHPHLSARQTDSLNVPRSLTFMGWWVDEFIHSLLSIKSDWMHLRTHRFYLFYCDSGQRSPTYPLLHSKPSHWLNRSLTTTIKCGRWKLPNQVLFD